MFIRLKLEPQHPLQITRGTNRIYCSEAVQVCCRIGNVSNKRAARASEIGSRVNAVKLRMVESIKSVEPRFDLVMLGESKTLRQREIPIVERRQVQIVASRLEPFASNAWCCEYGCIEHLVRVIAIPLTWVTCNDNPC